MRWEGMEREKPGGGPGFKRGEQIVAEGTTGIIGRKSQVVQPRRRQAKSEITPPFPMGGIFGKPCDLKKYTSRLTSVGLWVDVGWAGFMAG
jgi:hypothetical protein